MNKKLIAAAVSAAVAPVAAQAEVTLYGRIGHVIDVNDLAADEDSNTDVTTDGSRIGVKYTGDIGNGMTAHGQLEFGLTTDKEKANENENDDDEGSGGIEDTRVGMVALSGPFGRVSAGNQWSAYFNTFATLISPTYSLGYYIYSSVGSGPYRGSNTIKYSNDFGPVHAELDIRLNDNNEGSGSAEKIRGNGVGLGLSWAVTDWLTIGAAVDREDGADDDDQVSRAVTTNFEDDDVANQLPVASYKYEADDDRTRDADRVGIAVKGNFGNGYWVSVGWQNYETDDLGDVTIAGVDNSTTPDGDTTDPEDLPDVTAAGEEGVDIDTTHIYFGGNIGEKTNWLVGYSEADISDSDLDDPEQLVWGIYHRLGGGLVLFYEATDYENEGGGMDGDRHFFGMRVNF